MTPEAQRIAIAEACGWRLSAQGPSDKPYKWIPPSGTYLNPWCRDRKAADDFAFHHMRPNLPDYLNDLNAMHEAEKVLDKNQAEHFCEFLFSAVTSRGAAPYRWPWVVVHTTAAQRAEAFLPTLNLWDDTK